MKRLGPLLVWLVAGMAQGSSDYDFVRPLAPESGGALHLDTPNGQPQSLPSRFALPTTLGELRGQLSWKPSVVRVLLSLDDEHALLTAGPYDPLGPAIAVRLHFWGVGSMEYTISATDGSTRLVRHDVLDCSLLERSRVRQAIVDAERRFRDAFVDLDPDAPDRTDYPTAVVYFWLRLGARLPALVRDCGLMDPQYGVCVVAPSYTACMTCCERSAGADRLLMGACGLVAVFSANPIVGAACLGAIGGDVCREETCEGKPGDPDPIGCSGGGEPGVCKRACEQPGHNTGPCPDRPNLVCCIGE